jgi:hypothetical protein
MVENRVFYWERQGQEHTCGIHTLNSILQGPYFNRQSFKAKAEDLHRQHSAIEEDAKNVFSTQDIIAEDGCSMDLLIHCLAEYGIECDYMNFSNEYEWR